MKHILIILVLVLSIGCASAQKQVKSDPSKEPAKVVKKDAAPWQNLTS